MLRWRSQVALFALVMVITGCQDNRATGPYFQKPLSTSSQEAVIYFCRPPEPSTPKLYSDAVFDSGQLIGWLDHGGYFRYATSAGPHRFSLSAKINPADVWLETMEGKLYFVKWDYVNRPAYPGGTMYDSFIKLVDATEALEELQRCRLMEPAK